jgi:hypothetical protein
MTPQDLWNFFKQKGAVAKQDVEQAIRSLTPTNPIQNAIQSGIPLSQVITQTPQAKMATDYVSGMLQPTQEQKTQSPVTTALQTLVPPLQLPIRAKQAGNTLQDLSELGKMRDTTPESLTRMMPYLFMTSGPVAKTEPPLEPQAPTGGEIGGVTKELPDRAKLVLQELKNRNIPVNPDGTVDLYHATSPENAKNIVKNGIMGMPEDAPSSYGVYASTGKSVAEDYGSGGLVKIKVPLKDLAVDGTYADRVDVIINTNGKKTYKPISVSSGEIPKGGVPEGPLAKLKAQQQLMQTNPEQLVRGGK